MPLFTSLCFPLTNSEATRYNVRRDDYGPYLNQLLRAFAPVQHTTEKAAAPRVTSPALAEPLTARKLEVLRLIAAGNSNSEVAATMVVTISIFGKLDVASRTQGQVRARQLHLL